MLFKYYCQYLVNIVLIVIIVERARHTLGRLHGVRRSVNHAWVGGWAHAARVGSFPIASAKAPDPKGRAG